MPRYSDVDKLDDVVQRLNDEGWEITRYEYKRIESVLFEFPTADVVERKKGKWKKKWHSYFERELPCCSVCGHFSAMRWKYCPNCGAKMDGKEETNDKD